jgi:AraC family transcriptional regulator
MNQGVGWKVAFLHSTCVPNLTQNATSKEGLGNKEFDVSRDLENKPPVRIRVRQGREWVTVAPGVPTLSSAQSPWGGALLERHIHGPYTSDRHQHRSYFVSLHLSDPAPFLWRSQGGQGNKIIESGSINVLSRGTEDWVSFPKPVERIVLNLELDVFRQACPEHDTGRDFELISRWAVQDSQLEYTLRALEAELEAGSPGGRVFAESLLCALAVRLQQSYGMSPPTGPRARNGLPKARLNRVIEYIEANLNREIALAALAETAGYSRSHFLRMFRTATGHTPHHYVLQLRLKRAQELMRLRPMSLIEIASHCGFSSHAHMSRAFRHSLGVTPSQYRRNCFSTFL